MFKKKPTHPTPYETIHTVVCFILTESQSSEASISRVWSFRTILRPNSFAVSIAMFSLNGIRSPTGDASIRPPCFEFFHQSSPLRTTNHHRCSLFAIVAAFSPTSVCVCHASFATITSFSKGWEVSEVDIYPPPKKNNRCSFYRFYPILCALLCGGFDIHLKIQPKKCIG